MMQFIDVLNSNPWLRFLLNATMKSLVIFAVAGILAFLLRSKSAALRGLVWNMAILGCLMVSVFFLTLMPYEIGVLPGKPVGFETNVSIEDNQLAVTPDPMAPRPLPTTAASLTHTTTAPIQPEPATGESSAPQLNGWWTTFVSLHWTDWLALAWAGGRTVSARPFGCWRGCRLAHHRPQRRFQRFNTGLATRLEATG